MIPQNVHVGAFVSCATQALAPAAQVAGTRSGSAIDVSQFQSGVLVANIGATSGTPTTLSVTYSLESSANGTDGWTAVTDLDGVALAVQSTAASKAVELDFSLQFLKADHGHLRVKEVVAFTGGTAPTLVTGVTLVLGGGQRLPV
ncbi:hypothetical protein D7V97_15610 [Corallococcus sp. CA053C]|uniref:hypothetical protein n=1 Tax=Corallococcus sp. CA053C TaxID=2316732 RepID=UPI000EA0DAFF|nr:hypothetical protein [Corallococcus sp. CA053C]RKH09737.1 hypothetical protein D7V97_15610 [Corallococcus sp. CA053C]